MNHYLYKKTDVAVGYFVLIETNIGEYIFEITGIDNIFFWCKDINVKSTERHNFAYRDIKEVYKKSTHPEYYL